ncbi:TPA: efflux RND transporter periplasmic adaptor subunit, partial [Klebsiella pneumoniae]|nr:efflux RND transporter periplasmic adaptor subunit [Klebsiella pneumoniae]
AKLQSAQADLSSAADRLGYARLLSPVTGVVTTVSAGPGQVVTTGQEILRVAQSGARDAVFSVPGALADTLKQQQTLTLRMADNPSVSVTGTLRDISPQADTQTRTWRVRYDLENAPAVMAMGATVTGSLPLGGSEVFQVPASALTRKEQKPAVFVVDTGKNRLRLTPVDIAAYMTDSVLIRKGLTAGEQVVTAGVSQLRDGENVLTENQK